MTYSDDDLFKPIAMTPLSFDEAERPIDAVGNAGAVEAALTGLLSEKNA